MGEIKIVAICIVSIFIIINLIINENLRAKIFSILNKRIFKTKILIKDLLIIAIFLVIIWRSINLLNKTKENFDFINEDISNQEESLNKSIENGKIQNSKYDELMKLETNIENCKNPYIPDNFKYLEGAWNTGFVIEDEKGNQFVWVPCTNNQNDEDIPILKKQKFTTDNETYFDCYEEDWFEDFIKSSLENGGFYISRFEIGNENDIPVSKKGKEIWDNISLGEAKKISENMYNDINSKLINGYAFDTAISFIYNNIDTADVPKSTGITGNKSYKNIYDLFDDNLEWTSEQRYGFYLCRGTINIWDENLLFDRFMKNDKATLNNLCFRTIIYK